MDIIGCIGWAGAEAVCGYFVVTFGTGLGEQVLLKAREAGKNHYLFANYLPSSELETTSVFSWHYRNLKPQSISNDSQAFVGVAGQQKNLYEPRGLGIEQNGNRSFDFSGIISLRSGGWIIC